ncbi:MAG: hypothetical protein Q7J32_11705 [Sphingomonadaceae bacterium]|nr:hypothetical protein [Sphingomonadaceae bacterium]
MRSLLTLAGAASLSMLGGCDFIKGGSGEIARCEAFVKAQLRSPSTYKRVHASVFDSRLLTAAEFQERLGDKVPPPESALRLRSVSLTYEADNGFGVPIEERADCQFKVTEEERDAELISPDAITREIEEQRERENALKPDDDLASEDLFGPPPAGYLRSPCCLPPAGS